MIRIAHIGQANHGLLAKLYAFRYQIYVQEDGFLAPDSSLGKLEFDTYDPHSTHFAAFDNDTIVGCVRVVHNVIGLPILDKTKMQGHSAFTKRRNFEVGRLMVCPQLRGSLLAVRLMRTAFEECQQRNCDNIIIDVFKGQLTHRILSRVGFQPVGEEYEDTSFALPIPSVALYLDTSGHTGLFSLSNIMKNLDNYSSWLTRMEHAAVSV